MEWMLFDNHEGETMKNDMCDKQSERQVSILTQLKRETKALRKELAKQKRILRMKAQCAKLRDCIYEYTEGGKIR